MRMKICTYNLVKKIIVTLSIYFFFYNYNNEEFSMINQIKVFLLRISKYICWRVCLKILTEGKKLDCNKLEH